MLVNLDLCNGLHVFGSGDYQFALLKSRGSEMCIYFDFKKVGNVYSPMTDGLRMSIQHQFRSSIDSDWNITDDFLNLYFNHSSGNVFCVAVPTSEIVLVSEPVSMHELQGFSV